MTQVKKLIKRLEEMKVTNLRISRGSDPNVTAEQVATEINKALDSIEAGNFEELGILDDY